MQEEVSAVVDGKQPAALASSFSKRTAVSSASRMQESESRAPLLSGDLGPNLRPEKASASLHWPMARYSAPVLFQLSNQHMDKKLEHQPESSPLMRGLKYASHKLKQNEQKHEISAGPSEKSRYFALV
jgi:hypothetical protein